MTTASPRISRLNHAVLYVNDAAASAAFYCDVLGFSVANSFPGGAFLRAGGSGNDHDLGLFSVGAQPAPQQRIGLYHLAWQVDTIDELVEIAARLESAGAMVGASDHGVSKSLYARDIDGIEFEIMWAVPQRAWHDEESKVKIAPLGLAAEQAKWSGVSTAAELNLPA